MTCNGRGDCFRPAALFSVALIVVGASAIVRADWGQEGGNAARTGYADVTLQPTPKPLWQMDYLPFDGGEYKSPAAGNGRLFVAKGVSGVSRPQGDLRTYNLFTGQLLWKTAAPNPYSTPDITEATYANNKVYIQTVGHSNGAENPPLPAGSPIIYSFDARTGVRTTLAQHSGQWPDRRVTVNDDYVFSDTGYYGGTGGWSLRSSVTWARKELDSGSAMGDLDYYRYRTAANDSTIYLYRGYDRGAGSPYRRLIGMNERSGELALDYRIAGAEAYSYGEGRWGRIALGSQNNALIDFKFASVDYIASVNLGGTGSENWRTPLDGAVPRDVAIANGVVYVQTDAAQVMALNESTGQKLWTWSLPKAYSTDRLEPTMVITDSHLLVTSSSGYVPSNIYAIDASTGQGGIYIANESLYGLSDGVLMTHGRGNYQSGVFKAYRVTDRVRAELTPLIDGKMRVGPSSYTLDGESTVTVQNAAGIHDDGLLEFDLGGLPAEARIGSAILTLDMMLVGGALDGHGGLAILGYSGNGLLDVGDASGASAMLAQPTVTDLGTLSIELDTAFLQSLLSPDAVLGLRLQTWGTLTQYGFSAVESDRLAPGLSITYSVPEPSAGVAIMAVLSLLGCRRSQRGR